MKDYYQLLGVSSSASGNDIKKAYRKLSLKFHPDKNPGDPYFEQMFKGINEAYETLSNSNLRKVYDIEFKARKGGDEPKGKRRLPLKINFFSVDKQLVHIGDEIVIKWKTENATKVKISGLPNDQDMAGEKTIRVPKLLDRKNFTISLSALNDESEFVESRILLKILEGEKANHDVSQDTPIKTLNIHRTYIFGILILIVAALFYFNTSDRSTRHSDSVLISGTKTDAEYFVDSVNSVVANLSSQLSIITRQRDSFMYLNTLSFNRPSYNYKHDGLLNSVQGFEGFSSNYRILKGWNGDYIEFQKYPLPQHKVDILQWLDLFKKSDEFQLAYNKDFENDGEESEGKVLGIELYENGIWIEKLSSYEYVEVRMHIPFLKIDDAVKLFSWFDLFSIAPGCYETIEVNFIAENWGVVVEFSNGC